MHFDSFMHISFCFRASNTCRHTAWQVGRIGRIVAFSFFHDDTDAVHSFLSPFSKWSVEIIGVAPHGPRAEWKGLQASPRGRNAGTASARPGNAGAGPPP